MVVALKSLDNSKDVTLKFMNEILLHNKGKIDNNFIVGFYGITQDPKTKDYMMILDYAKDGSLRDHLDKNYRLLTYESRLLDFNSLPEPKNSDDYYEQNDNIISKEFSESLEYCQVNIP
ncbi:unnamed protein product [Rhizophagus irregularis]|nr:unnamed protein product [Rhizophagus irregularis]